MNGNRGSVLAVPAFGPGLGGGHLVRCTALVRDLRALGRDARLFVPADTAESLRGFLGTRRFDPAWIAGEADLKSRNWECVILDRFRTPHDEYLDWSRLAPVIAIDEGGDCRDRFTFLIDVLPNLSHARPNVADPSLLPLPPEYQEGSPSGDKAPAVLPRVLISFGQEDPAGLGPAVADALAGGGLDLTLLRGGLGTWDTDRLSQGVRVMETIPNLSERLGEYDLVITHFGLTAFESLYAGVPVLLLSPTGHHEKVARKAGFCSLGTGRGGAGKLAKRLLKKNGVNRVFLRGLENRCRILATKHNVDHAPGKSLAELVNGFTPDSSRGCPVCGTDCAPVLARFSERTYRRCAACGIIAMDRLTPPPIEYAREYFFGFYEKQYGKTYIDDFPNLIAMGTRRLALIKSLLPASGATSLLDIGCAYGPFLVAARDRGFSPRGVDPAEDAVQYVTETLGIPALRGFFPCATGEPNQRYDVVTLWFVIEHFRYCVPVLAEIRKILKPGGVLALATPSFSGISGRGSLRRFLDRSPADHWTLWSPGACRKALAMAGFRVRRIVVCGHHPERFPFFGRYARDEKGLVYRLLLAISRIFALGDTFEAYALREADESPPRGHLTERALACYD